MGVILDSSVLIAAERKGRSVRQALADVLSQVADDDLGLSAISVFELNHGAYRAHTSQQEISRRRFLEQVASLLPIYPVTYEVALRAGRIDGETAAKGVRIAVADLLIGVTALELSYRVLTGNMRHFRLIPGLQVLAVE